MISSEIESKNCFLIRSLVSHFSARFPVEMPQPYKRLLANISKHTSVAGFLQSTGPMAITYLREYAERSLDLRLRGNKDKLDNVAEELPALWPMLLDILNLEETNFMNEL